MWVLRNDRQIRNLSKVLHLNIGSGLDGRASASSSPVVSLTLQVNMTTDLAYLAGLFDGEGTITLGKGSNPKAFRRVEITLSSTDKCLCDLMLSILGFGEVYTKSSRKPAHWAQAYEYRISGDNALRAAALLLPYCRHPQKIARLSHVLTFHKRVTIRNGKYTVEQATAKRAYEEKFFTL